MNCKSIYLVYSHEYNTGYVGKSKKIKQRFTGHCSKGAVKRFCDALGIQARHTFDIFEIMKCVADEASYYEGHVYDLITSHVPSIKLLNKNKPNRNQRDSLKNWRRNNCDRCKQYLKQWLENNHEYRKQYHKQWCESNRERRKQYKNQWRENNRDRCNQYLKQWRENNRERCKQYKKRWLEHKRTQLI